MNRLLRNFLAYQIENEADPWAKAHVGPAFQGSVRSAFSLSIALRNDQRGKVAVAMWQAKVPRKAFRAYLSSVWVHDHHHVIAAAKTRRCLACMFRYAAFTLPEDLPERVQVWRGTSGIPFEVAVAGYSWTTDRATACWFAMRSQPDAGSPLVVTATVSKSRIVYASNEREEHEVVLMRPPPGARVDGDQENWQIGYQQFQNERKASKADGIKRVRERTMQPA
jgi:hypothetical protein